MNIKEQLIDSQAAEEKSIAGQIGIKPISDAHSSEEEATERKTPPASGSKQWKALYAAVGSYAAQLRSKK